MQLEQARQAKTIGKALEAQLKLSGPAAQLESVLNHQEALRELLNVSALSLAISGDEKLSITLAKADGRKCERCWHWETDIGAHADHPTLCGRCVEAVAGQSASAAA
jgi:isoleucyl-tRNA synthetase